MAHQVIRFDKEQTIFKEEDFSFNDPNTWDGGKIKITRSSLKFKKGECQIRFPPVLTFGLQKSEFNTEAGYILTYPRDEEETPEQESFYKYVKELEKYYKNFILNLDKKKLPSFCQRITEDEIKPLFIYPKDKDGNIDNTKKTRIYLKAKMYNNELKLDIYDYNARSINYKKCVNKKGRYIPIVMIKGIFFGNHGQNSNYKASLQMEISTLLFSLPPSMDPKILLGEEYVEETVENTFDEDKTSDTDEEEELAKLRKKMELEHHIDNN